MKTVAIVQSNYIPWRGYFDLIASADEFILLDDVQYTKRDWRNRNKIKTPQGTQWVTIPVDTKGKYQQLISETKVKSFDWQLDHWSSIQHNYARAAYFERYAPEIEVLYRSKMSSFLSHINEKFLTHLCQLLEINTRITHSSDYQISTEDKSYRLVELCQKAGASQYLSGPKAKAYLDIPAFHQAGIDVAFIDYSQYGVYPQCHGAFEQSVSIIDMVFNLGPEAAGYFEKNGHQHHELQPRNHSNQSQRLLSG